MGDRSPGSRHGFPHLDLVRESIRILYERLTPTLVAEFTDDLPIYTLRGSSDADLIVDVQTLAGVIVKHFRLPPGAALVGFRELSVPGRVELGRDHSYLIDLSTKFRRDVGDIGGVLAHEVVHIFLHRHGIWLRDTFANEVLTDTAAAFLGAGWPILNGYRVEERETARERIGNEVHVTVTKTEKSLGYLTPEEFGYILAKRELVFGRRRRRLLRKETKRAFSSGMRVARTEYSRPPLRGAGRWRRRRYRKQLQSAERELAASGADPRSHEQHGYHFEQSDGIKVIFPCPVCWQRLRVPTGRRLRAYCPTCQARVECST